MTEPLKPCGCLAYDPVENGHTEDEHTSCGGSLHDGVVPCGGCDSCISAQVSYYRNMAAFKDIANNVADGRS